MSIRLNLTYTALIASVVLSIGLVAPAFSEAATFCVMAGQACPAGSKDIPLDAAIISAEQNPGPDKILLGDLGQPYVGPFSVNNVAAPEQIDIVAVGATRPVLTAADSETLAIGLRKGSLQGVEVRTPINPNSVAVGIRLDQSALRDVRVTGGSAVKPPSAIRAVGQARIDDTTVDFTQINFGSSGVEVTPTGSVSADGLTVKDAGRGLVVTNGSLFATRSHIEGRVFGILQFGGGVHVSRSVVATKTASAGVLVADDSFTVLDHVTVAERELHPAAVVPGLQLNASNANGQVILESVAMAGFDKGIGRFSANGHTVNVQASQSVWKNGADDAGPITETNNIHAEPEMVDRVHGDLRPRAGSVLIDTDLTAPAGQYFDADGIATVDGDGDAIGRPDAGGLEYRRRAPEITAASIPAAGAPAEALAFSAAASDPDGDAVTLSWSFGDGASSDGAAVQHGYAAPGTYTVTVTARDQTGLTATRSATVTIPSPPEAIAGAAPSPGASGAAPAGDNTAPVLRRVGLRPAKVRASRARRLRLEVDLSEAASLRITARREVRRGGRTRLVAAPGRITRRVLAGSSRIALAAALQRMHLVRHGRLVLKVAATDAAGNRSPARSVRLRIL